MVHKRTPPVDNTINIKASFAKLCLHYWSHFQTKFSMKVSICLSLFMTFLKDLFPTPTSDLWMADFHLSLQYLEIVSGSQWLSQNMECGQVLPTSLDIGSHFIDINRFLEQKWHSNYGLTFFKSLISMALCQISVDFVTCLKSVQHFFGNLSINITKLNFHYSE